MKKSATFNLTAKLTAKISATNPVFDFSAKELKNLKNQYTAAELQTLKEMGWLGDDFETFTVILSFLEENNVFDSADDEYISQIFKTAKKFGVNEFYNDEYIKNVTFPQIKKDNFLLTTATYERGELFLYDAPDLSAETIVPKIGFFNGKVKFPTLYEGNMPWMSVCPSEINSMQQQIELAFGKVLALGCGLGYYQYAASQKQNVESVTIVEISPTVTQMFEEYILPHFPHKEKINIVCRNAIDYMNGVEDGQFDFVFADIWEGIVDGAEHYLKIRAHEQRLPQTKFTYWIEPQIKYYLQSQ